MYNASHAPDSPIGPEDYDDHEPINATTPVRTSFSSTPDSKRGKGFSKLSTPLGKAAKYYDEKPGESDEAASSDGSMQTQLSSQKDAPQYSPPPSIHLDLVQTDLLDSSLLKAVGLNQAEFVRMMNNVPDEPIATPGVRRCDGRMEVVQRSQEVYLPSRNTTDHWRTSQARIYAPSSTAGSLLNLDKLLEGDEAMTYLHGSFRPTDSDLPSMDGTFEHQTDTFEAARAKFSAKRRKESAEPSDACEQNVEHSDCSRFAPIPKRIKAKNVQKALHVQSVRDPGSPTSRTEHETSNNGFPIIIRRSGETPGPGKTLELPIRLIAHKHVILDAPPPNLHILAGAQQAHLQGQSSDESSDELSSPLNTQDIFASDSENSVDGAYALELNDLVEKATRRNSMEFGRVEEHLDVAALLRLSDLKRSRQSTESRSKMSPPIDRSRSVFEMATERTKLEQEAIGIVFPEGAPRACTIDTGRTVGDQSSKFPLLPGFSIHEENLEHRKPVMLSGHTRYRCDGHSLRDGGCGAPSKHNLGNGESLPRAISADSACLVPVCQVCGRTDDHICEVLSPFKGLENNVDTRYNMRGTAGAACPDMMTRDDVFCSLQRKSSDPVGLELHRLGDQAVAWLQGLSSDSNREPMSGSESANSTLKAAWKWPRNGGQDRVAASNSRVKETNKITSVRPTDKTDHDNVA